MADYVSLNPDGVPEPLRALPQWVVWRAVQNADGDVTKPPYKVRDCWRRANATSPDDWAAFDAAVAMAQEPLFNLAGIGFALRPENGLVALDLDLCIVDGNKVVPWACDLCQRLDTYTEYSPSGRGLRLFLLGGPVPRHGNKKVMPGLAVGKKRPAVECYDHVRYVTITGRKHPKAPPTINARGEAFAAWHREVFGAPTVAATGAARAQWLPDGGPLTPLTYYEIDALDKARFHPNGQTFVALWMGQGDPDRSRGDYRLICSLIRHFRTTDPRLLDRLFRHSGRMREKWDDRRGPVTYGVNTIEAALATVGQGVAVPA